MTLLYNIQLLWSLTLPPSLPSFPPFFLIVKAKTYIDSKFPQVNTISVRN